MDVTHDLIAAVNGPGWKYGLSRVLIDAEGNGAVFIAGSQEPFAQFTVSSVSTSRGVGRTADGGEVTWRRRGSSCQYKLAKCKVSTATMTSWWTASLASETTGEEMGLSPEYVASVEKTYAGTTIDTESLEDLL